MENKHVGFLILGIAFVLVFIIFLFNSALTTAVRNSCLIQHGDIESCEMYDSVNYQKYLALGIVGILLIIGFVLVFSKPKEKIVVKQFKEKKKKMDLSGLDSREREVIKILEQENGTIFQATLMEKLGTGKVGITRLLDKLEAKQLIERKRRGMNNIVVLRD
ncbi:MAG: hypothetical protein Q8P79_02940 [Nanoarchaeota archaeon]|nr:hypothetical protein [Nanoarchaeota archaeon]